MIHSLQNQWNKSIFISENNSTAPNEVKKALKEQLLKQESIETDHSELQCIKWSTK